ncbi:MAG: GTP-binding protein [Candidatus Helarchaeota archaeon]|nr:GTP-binding protein [Candidatus Helarchaeota archaeon]
MNIRTEVIKIAEEESYVFKILLLGDGAVGKTSLLRRFIDNTFIPDYKGTIGVQFMTKNVELENKNVKLVVWDVAGQSRFTSYRHLYYKDADGIILVYDITRYPTFENLEKWVTDAVKYTEQDIQIAVLANKVDLFDNRNVSEEEGRLYSALREAVLFSETSAKTGKNVDNAFLELAKNLIKTSRQNK